MQVQTQLAFSLLLHNDVWVCVERFHFIMTQNVKMLEGYDNLCTAWYEAIKKASYGADSLNYSRYSLSQIIQMNEY